MIKEISCKGYRGFSKLGTLQLAIPNGKKGSGLTILVGPNGGGKSTLVECFSKIAMSNVSFTEGKRNKLAGDKIDIEITYDNGDTAKLTTVSQGGSETQLIGKQPKIYFLPSRRVFNPYFSKNEWNRDTFIENPENNQFRGLPLTHFTYRLFDAYRNLNNFNKMFWRILGKELEWTIDQDDTGQYYVKVKKHSSLYHNSDGLGEGIVSLLFIVDAIFEAKPSELIVIDEPELSLHPQLQVRLLNEILELTKTVQVVISTHSANMVSIEAAIKGGVIARVFEKGNSSVISCINDTCRKYFESYNSNLYNPHTFGNDARACLFAEDGLIITEGQEDVMLYPHLLKQLGFQRDEIPFFGFGAGGANNIINIAYILKCLGFSRIGAIFDGDKKEEYLNFIQEYKQDGYKAWIIPADDIRTKKATSSNTKLGLLNHKGDLDPQYIKCVLINMFKKITQFISSKS